MLAGRTYVDEGVPNTTRSAVVVLASGMVVSERSGQLPLPLLADGPGRLTRAARLRAGRNALSWPWPFPASLMLGFFARVTPEAKFLPEITHREAIERRLAVMDSTALSLCMDNALPIHVFNMDDEENIFRIVSGERVGTVVST